jgi:tetratricopeptide (TPR) repeat protein
MWDLKGNLIGKPIYSPLIIENDSYKEHPFTFSPDGKSFAIRSHTETIGVWDLEGNPITELIEEQEYKFNSNSSSVIFSPNGKTQVKTSNNKLELRDQQDILISDSFGEHKNLNLLMFSQDGQTVISGDEQRVRLWRGHWLSWLKVCCNRLKHHSAFKNPQTEDEKSAYDIANRYVFNPQIGADELCRKGKQKLATKDYTAAVDILTLAIQIYPEHLQSYRYRGIALACFQQYYRAIKDCSHILENNPNDADVIYTRGLCYAKLDEVQQAQADYKKYMTLHEQQGEIENSDVDIVGLLQFCDLVYPNEIKESE